MGVCVLQEYHIDGFRFDLAAILTRAPSAWHSADWVTPNAAAAAAAATGQHGHSGAPPGQPPPGSPGAPPHAPADLHSGGAILCDQGYMTDGAGTATGTPLGEPPVVEMISEDPVLRNTKLIAEAWDCDGLNQVRRLARRVVCVLCACNLPGGVGTDARCELSRRPQLLYSRTEIRPGHFPARRSTRDTLLACQPMHAT